MSSNPNLSSSEKNGFQETLIKGQTTGPVKINRQLCPKIYQINLSFILSKIFIVYS